jgi:ethanolamine permease
VNEQERWAAQGVEYEDVGAEYLRRRQLRTGAAGPLLLAALGIGYVIAGDFAGWNFGLDVAGWGGLLIATLLMAGMYVAMCFALSEMSSMVPTAGGGYGFARAAMGPWGGFLTGTAVLIEYALTAAVNCFFIGAYTEALFGFNGPLVYLLFFAVFIGIHLYGVGEALKLMFVVTAISAVGIIVFAVGMIPHFDPANLFNIAPTDAAGASSFLPFGYLGIWAALPYAMWFFLAIEGLPLAAEEARDPARDMPKGFIGGIAGLLLFAALILTLGVGGAGSAEIRESASPLVDAVQSPNAFGSPNLLSSFINIVGLIGLTTSFFAVIFAYSRQTFALSRAGYLPRALSLTGSRRTPWVALIVPGIVGFVLTLTGQGNLLILIAVFGATISYVLMMLSHIILRYKEPNLERPYKTPGGVFTSGVALVLALVATVAGLFVEPIVVVYTAVIYALFIAYFALYSRHHLVAQAPEEEFALIEEAEAELAGGQAASGSDGVLQERRT